MGLVIAVAAVALVGCYEPSLRDCAIPCAAIGDCAAGQACSAGMCAGPGVTCAPGGESGDASELADGPAPSDTDAHHADAALPDAPPDAPANDVLHVTIAGKGQVVVDGIGTCTGGVPATTGDCYYSVPPTGTLTAHAEAVVEDHAFDKWSDPICKNQPATCVFAPLPLTAITAHFK